MVDGGEAEMDYAVDTVNHRAGKDFAIGEVFVPVAVDPAMAGHAHADIGAVGGNHVVIGSCR